MKKMPLIALALALALASGLVGLWPQGGEAQAQVNLGPQECVCAPGLNLAPAGSPPSIIRSCHCGVLQCVVHVGSGNLQCR